MATKKSKKESVPAGPTEAIDPFAAPVEPLAGSGKPGKPQRPIKVIKAVKPVASVAADRAESGASSLGMPIAAADPFAEVASSSAAEDEVTLELPAIVPERKVHTTKKSPSVAKPKPRAKAVKSETVKTDTPEAPKAKRSSNRKVVTEPTVAGVINGVSKEIAATEPDVELSPVFKALAEVKLPELPRENRARLQVQSPTRLYFYWSLKQNPWQQLRAVFGPELGSYALVVKLRNLTKETENIHPIETQGEWWFDDAEPDMEYMAEIGFYAINRPYFRVLYSNSVKTPRRSPSTHPATESRWTVSATKFAEVLDASGFTRDAVEVVIAGDDHLDAEARTNLAFSKLIGEAEYSTRNIPAEDLRRALVSLAAGTSLDTLRHRISAPLYNVLQANTAKLSASGARKALTDHFDIDETEWTEQDNGPMVFGASLVNFPKTFRSRTGRARSSPRYHPLSSFTLGR